MVLLLAAATLASLHWAQPAYAPWLLLAAIVLAAWYGGGVPAAVATLLGSGVLAAMPQFGLPGASDWPGLAFFFAIALGITGVAAARERTLSSLRRNLDGLTRSESELQHRVAHLAQSRQLLEQRHQQVVAERDQLQASLRTAGQRMNIAQEAARLCLFELDIAGHQMEVIGDVNAMFGTPAARWPGAEAWLQLVHPEDHDRVQSALRSAMEDQRPLALEFRVVWPDGSLHWIAARGVLDTTAPAGKLIGIFQDVTERRRAEQALVQNEKLAAAGRLATTIAHEINNPLTALMNLFCIVQNDSSLSQAGRQYLQLAEQELKRVANLARQTLGFYRESASPVLFDVAEVLDDVLALYAHNMPSSVRIEKRYAEGLHVRAVRGELHQVCANLVSNSVHALALGGTLTVSARTATNRTQPVIAIEVADDGPGIPEEHLGRIFEPFFTTKPAVGTGLGLWLVKQIVERHGGSVKVQASTEGARHGARFSVVLPAAVSSHKRTTVA